MIHRRRKHRRRQVGGVGPDSQSLEERILASQGLPPVPQPAPAPAPTPATQRPRPLRQDPNVTRPQTPMEQRRDAIMKQRSERVRRLATDQRVSDIKQNESPGGLSELGRALTAPAKKPLTKAAEFTEKRSKEFVETEAGQEFLEKGGKAVAIIETTAKLGTAIVAPETIPTMTFLDTKAAGESTGKAVLETAKTVPFVLSGPAAKTAALGVVVGEAAQGIADKDPGATVATDTTLGLLSILPEGKAAGKEFKALTRAQKAARATRETAKIAKDVVGTAREIRNAGIEEERIKKEAREEKRQEQLLDDAKKMNALTNNPDMTFTQTQLASIKEFLKRNPNYKPSEHLQNQLDSKFFDQPEPIPSPVPVAKVKPTIQKSPEKLKIKSEKPKFKKVPKKLIVEKENRTRAPVFPTPTQSIKDAVRLQRRFKQFIVERDVDSVIRTGFTPSHKRTTVSVEGVVEVDCSKLKNEKERRRCEHNKMLAKKKKKKKK
jgi:hypothetical protein